MKSLPMNTATARRALALFALLPAVFLAGCRMDDAITDDYYQPASVQERHPIRVAEAPVKMNLSAKAGTLRADQMNSLINFAQDARNNAASHVSVRWSSGSANARKVAEETVGVLVDQGVPRSMIGTGSYRGSSAVVSLAFTRKVAVTDECGDWSDNLAGDARNVDYNNYGCAQQNNMAAMVANPDDFEKPRAMTPVLGNTRSLPVKYYLDGKVPTLDSSSTMSGSVQ